MKKTDYNQELMNRYIEENFSGANGEEVSEEFRQLLANSNSFHYYCLNVYQQELINEIATSFHIYELGEWFAERRLLTKIIIIIGLAICIGLCIWDGYVGGSV